VRGITGITPSPTALPVRSTPDAAFVLDIDRVGMYARAVEDAAHELDELRVEEREDLGVGALGLGLALAATQIYPALAIPFFLGGLFVGGRGMRATWRRWEIVDRLIRDRDAYVIPEVFERASREATTQRRQTFAAFLRTWAEGEPLPDVAARVAAAREDIEALIVELEDEHLDLDVESAVACKRLLTDGFDSPLLNHALPPEDLRARICQIRCGFVIKDD
jgi:Asp-tRNA(Asn)/Glu-tRNA(Gln) amidotransferase A subunit family amidase